MKICEKDLESQVVAKEVCRRDYKYFVNNFCWTFDPRPDRKPHHFPFVLYDFQEDFLDWLEKRYSKKEDGLIDKSRDMGATWCYLAWDLHKWLFEPGFQALLGSRTQDKVDKIDDPSSLFWKLAYLLEKLPEWLLPEGFNRNKHRKYLLLINPENGNTISGESANAEFSRQGRYSVIHFDEFAFWPFANSAWTAASEASPVRIPVSTPNGMNNKFASLRWDSSIKVTSLNWKKHPLKDNSWYEKESRRKTAKELAQEVDIDYKASGGDIWLPWYQQKKTDIEQEFSVGDEWNIYLGVDHHPRNPTSIHFYGVDYERNIFSIDEFYRANATTQDMADWLLNHWLWPRVKDGVGDPQLWARDQEVRQGVKAFVQVSRAYMLEEKGIKLRAGHKGQDMDARDMTKDIILAGKLKIHPRCKMQRWEFSEALRWDDYTEQLGQKKGYKESLADKNNHAWDDWKYFILENFPVPVIEKPPIVKNSLDWFDLMEKKQYKDEGAYV